MTELSEESERRKSSHTPGQAVFCLSFCLMTLAACSETSRAIPTDTAQLDTQATELPVADVTGFHTSTSELEAIRLRAESGEDKIVDRVERLISAAQDPWPYGDIGTRFGTINKQGKRCVPLNDTVNTTVLTNSGQRFYARVLAYHMTFETRYGKEARSILRSFSRSSGYGLTKGVVDTTGSNQCAFEISLLTPLLIESAMLLEAYSGWSPSDKAALQTWLAQEVYPISSALARTRKNNWGNIGAFASWAIAHYLLDSGMQLVEFNSTERVFSPSAAKQEYVETQLRILGNEWEGDSQCAQSGVQYHGGIPDELRRGSSGCKATFIAAKDLSYQYQQFTSSVLIYHAQAVLRQGNNELFQRRLPNGDPLILQTVLFVIDNADGQSHDWRPGSIGALRVLNDYYFDAKVCEQLDQSERFTEGGYLPFARFTYPDVCR